MWPCGLASRIARRITVTAHDLPAPVVPSTAKCLPSRLSVIAKAGRSDGLVQGAQPHGRLVGPARRSRAAPRGSPCGSDCRAPGGSTRRAGSRSASADHLAEQPDLDEPGRLLGVAPAFGLERRDDAEAAHLAALQADHRADLGMGWRRSGRAPPRPPSRRPRSRGRAARWPTCSRPEGRVPAACGRSRARPLPPAAPRDRCRSASQAACARRRCGQRASSCPRLFRVLPAWSRPVGPRARGPAVGAPRPGLRRAPAARQGRVPDPRRAARAGRGRYPAQQGPSRRPAPPQAWQRRRHPTSPLPCRVPARGAVSSEGASSASASPASPKRLPSWRCWRKRSLIDAQLRLSLRPRPGAVSAVVAEVASAAAGRARLNIEPPSAHPATRRRRLKAGRYQVRFAEP